MKNFIKKIRRIYLDSNKPLPKYFQIASLIESNKKILDFGCGEGKLSEILIKEKNAKAVGCDLIEKTNFKHKNFKYKQVSIKDNFPFEEKFDYIVFADVLEHLENPKEILIETFKHTARCIISIPNLNFFLYRLFPHLENPPNDLTPHLHHWTLNKFKEVLPKGVKIKRIKYCSDFPEFRWTNYFPFKNKSFFNQTLIMEVLK